MNNVLIMLLTFSRNKILSFGIDSTQGKRLTPPLFFPLVNPLDRAKWSESGEETSELRPRNVKASRRPGRKSFLVIHPSTGTGQAKNVNYGSAVQPERPHASVPRGIVQDLTPS